MSKYIDISNSQETQRMLAALNSG